MEGQLAAATTTTTNTHPTGYPLSQACTLVSEQGGDSPKFATTRAPTPEPGTTSSEETPQLTQARKYALLALFCLAQFLDVFNNSALFAAIPTLRAELGFDESGVTWLISAYQLTFASFLLMAGKISDVYNPKKAFVFGVAALGLVSLGAGFINSQIPLIVLRAFGGVFAALTIPSALTLLVNVFPDEEEQARAIGIFGGSGAVANVLGLIIGAIFVEYANWRWVFWFATIIALPVAAMCALLVPKQVATGDRIQPSREKLRRLDIPGVSTLTCALILFIFAVTSGSTAGWKSAMVLAPLFISVALIAAFLVWQTRVPEKYAAVPPRTWFLPNFAVLFGAALLPYFWWTAIFTIFTVLWQSVYGWSAISMAVHTLPIGIPAFAVSFTGGLSAKGRIQPKWLILGGQVLVLIATVLLIFADRPERYWPIVFPAFILGTTGAMFAYTHNNIAIFRTAPASMSGVIGALFNGALQLGSALGIAAITSIQTSVEVRAPGGYEEGFKGFEGRRAAFYFLLAVVAVEVVAVAVFYRLSKVMSVDVENADEQKRESVVNEKSI